MASDDQANPSLRLKDLIAPCRPLPYIPPSFPGELLSSWLRRIAAPAAIPFAKTPPGARAFDLLRELERDCWRLSLDAPSPLGSHP